MIDFEALTNAIAKLDEDDVHKILSDFIALNPLEEEVQKVVTACQKGMAVVGDLYEKGVYFVGDLIFAGELITETIDVLKLAIGSDSYAIAGKIVLGTARGDLHDIGKNIFKSLAEAAGFEVYDLGIDQPVEVFVDKVKKIKPDVLGMSGVLTLTLLSMKNTVDALKLAGLRDSVKIIIGGNPVTKEACDHIGADAFATSALEGVRIIQDWIQEYPYSIYRNLEI